MFGGIGIICSVINLEKFKGVDYRGVSFNVVEINGCRFVVDKGVKVWVCFIVVWIVRLGEVLVEYDGVFYGDVEVWGVVYIVVVVVSEEYLDYVVVDRDVDVVVVFFILGDGEVVEIVFLLFRKILGNGDVGNSVIGEEVVSYLSLVDVIWKIMVFFVID